MGVAIISLHLHSPMGYISLHSPSGYDNEFTPLMSFPLILILWNPWTQPHLAAASSMSITAAAGGAPGMCLQQHISLSC